MVDQTVTQSLAAVHPAVTLTILLDVLDRVAGMDSEALGQLVLGALNIFCGDLNVGGLPLHSAEGLVDHYLGIGQSGLDKLVQKSYELLGLISFLTAGTDEVRAWTITKGTKAPGAAGKIHTDFERGFIRAEVVPYETLIEQGSMAACKEKGLVRSEGKDYVVQDGDIIVFRFNV